MCCHHVGWMKNPFLHLPLLATAHNLRRMVGAPRDLPHHERQIRRGTEMHQAENVRSRSFGIIF